MSNILNNSDITNKSNWNATTHNYVYNRSYYNPSRQRNGVVAFRHKSRTGNSLSYINSLENNISLLKGGTYKISVWARTNDRDWKICVYSTNFESVFRTTDRRGRWKKYEWEITPTENISKISFKFDGNRYSYRRFHALYLPQATLISLPPLPPPPPPPPTEETKTDNTTTDNTTTESSSSVQTLTNFSKVYKNKIEAVVNLLVQATDGNFYYGTGFFISADGYIATAGHVVVGGNTIPEPFIRKVYVQIYPENIMVEGVVVGVDRIYDIGLIKVNLSNRKYFEWENSRNVEIGSYAVTIGHPLGKHVQSITSGIVSDNNAQDYSWMPESVLVDFTIIGGNSGGPVINLNEKVIGIVSWGYDVGNFSLNGSASSYVAEKVITSLKNKWGGSGNPVIFDTGYIGVNFEPIGIYDAISRGINKIQGVIVKSVMSGGPAQKAGIRGGDIIFEIDGKIIGKNNNQELFGSIIHFATIGSTLRVKINRNGRIIEVGVVIEKIPPRYDRIFSNVQKIKL